MRGTKKPTSKKMLHRAGLVGLDAGNQTRPILLLELKRRRRYLNAPIASLLRSSLKPTTAAPEGAMIFLGCVIVEVLLLLPMALAPEGNLRSAGSGDGGVFASFSSLGASSRSRLRLGDWWMAASSPRGLLRRGAGFCLATMMASRGAWVAAWSSVVGSSRRVRGALWGTVGASPAYFPCDDRRQSRSCRLFTRVAFCWHVSSWFSVQLFVAL